MTSPEFRQLVLDKIEEALKEIPDTEVIDRTWGWVVTDGEHEVQVQV